MNLIDQGRQRFARAQIATFLDVFDDVAVAGHGAPGNDPGRGNIVVLGSERPLPDGALPLRSRGVTVLRGDRVQSFVDGADVLRDEHRPTEPALAPRPLRFFQSLSPPWGAPQVLVVASITRS